MTENGEKSDILWGFADGGRFTSEFPANMMSHVVRLVVYQDNRVVVHCYAEALLAMICPRFG